MTAECSLGRPVWRFDQRKERLGEPLAFPDERAVASERGMTVYPLERVRSFRWDVQPTAGTIVDDTVVPRRCAVWRKAFKGSAVSYGAALLGHAPAVSWMRRHRVTVDIGTAGEFSRAVAAGIAPAQLVMHADTDAAVRCAVSGERAVSSSVPPSNSPNSATVTGYTVCWSMRARFVGWPPRHWCAARSS